MPTKDELTEQLSEAKARITELEAEGGGESETYENGLYVYNDGMGFTLAAQEPGTYTYDGDEATEASDMRVRAADGSFSAPEEDGVYRYDGTGDLIKVDTEGADTPTGAMNEQIEMLRKDLEGMKVQRDEARAKAARLEDQLKDSKALHGSIDTLKAPY